MESRLGVFGNYAENEETAGDIGEQFPFGVTVLVELEKGFAHEDNLEARLIAGGELSATSIAVNLSWQRTLKESGTNGAGYALGWSFVWHSRIDE